MHRGCLFAAVFFVVGSASSLAETTVSLHLAPVGVVTIEGAFYTDDGTPPARDISGIACRPAPNESAQRLCLVVNDADRFAQLATIQGGRLIVGATVPLIGNKPSPSTLGAKQQALACSEGEASFTDLDGEAVAYATPYFHVIGSHGCSRRNKYHPSRFILARVRVNEQGRVGDEAGHEPASPEDALTFVETTHCLADVLRAADPIGGHFGKDLGANGVNVEGLAVVNGTLYLGLRAPSLDGTAHIVSTEANALFSREDAPSPLRPGVIPLALGVNTGIRDLAPLGDGRLLVLAGPAQDQTGVAYALYAAEPRVGGRLTRLATLDEVGQDCKPSPRTQAGNPEAILPLSVDEDRLRVLILFDGLPNGAPCEYTVPIR